MLTFPKTMDGGAETQAQILKAGTQARILTKKVCSWTREDWKEKRSKEGMTDGERQVGCYQSGDGERGENSEQSKLRNVCSDGTCWE